MGRGEPKNQATKGKVGICNLQVFYLKGLKLADLEGFIDNQSNIDLKLD